jgi:hypothetical protein
MKSEAKEMNRQYTKSKPFELDQMVTASGRAIHVAQQIAMDARSGAIIAARVVQKDFVSRKLLSFVESLETEARELRRAAYKVRDDAWYECSIRVSIALDEIRTSVAEASGAK